jgi:hypothetical protein
LVVEVPRNSPNGTFLFAASRSLDLEVSGGLLAAIGDDLVFDLPLIQTAVSSHLDRGNVDEDVFPPPPALNNPKRFAN